jgi:EmrB/QacA subfamily drug resistance transporter
MPSTSLNASRPAGGSPPARRRAGSAPATTGVGTARRRLGPSWFLPVILASQLMVVLDTTIVNVALPHIQRGLHFSPTSLSWVLNAYILAFGGLLLLGARAGDLLGRRRTFLAGITLFSLSSLAGGFAVEGWMILAARALQGAGGALVAPSALALLTAAFPEGPRRMRAIGLFTTVSAAGGAIGLVAGGLLTQWVSWRWVMFVNVPIGIAVWAVGRNVLVETERRQGRLDLAGAVTSTLGMAGIVFGLVEAGSVGWADPLTLGSFVAGAVLLAAFVRNEARAEEPILPLRLLANPTRTTANLAGGLVYAGMYGMFFFLSQFLQDFQGYSPLRTGICFLPIPASVFLSSQLTSRVLVNRFRPKVIMLTGITLSAVSLVLSSRLQAGTPYLQIVGWLVLLGVGVGVSLVSLTSASLSGVQPRDAGAASGLINVAQQIGAALGLAALVTVFGDVTYHAQLVTATGTVANAQARSLLVRGLDDAFAVGAILAVVALVTVLIGIRPARPAVALVGSEPNRARIEPELSRPWRTPKPPRRPTCPPPADPPPSRSPSVRE